MHYYTQVKQIRETDAGTDLVIHIPKEKLRHQISKYSTGNTVDAEIRINDGRRINADQRKRIFATVKDIAVYTGDDPEYIRGILLYDYCAKTGEMPFSLSNCSVSQARDYTSHIMDFALEWNIPLTGLGIDRTEDVDRYLYSCIKFRRCAITGQANADIHHIDAVGMGGNRNEVDHSRLRLIALSRKWHNRVHEQGEQEIFDKYKIYGIKVDAATLKHIGIKTSEID
ncbi:MAG TPA: hypothetical protein GX707_16715 [Epulopiscium sp.]|nr:hypothetical protein [Candidatus Epulonipiscium sp.]